MTFKSSDFCKAPEIRVRNMSTVFYIGYWEKTHTHVYIYIYIYIYLITIFSCVMGIKYLLNIYICAGVDSFSKR
jgi:hypothetical protein